MRKNGYICVLDSGLGGVTVLAELLKIMPGESYIYFGDIKNTPYGEKSTEEVLNLTLKNIETLINRGAKAIVIACNTATGAAAKEAREKYPDLPIIGIEPAIKPAVKAFEGKNILIMATPLTLKQEKFDILYHKWNDMANIELLPCPGLAMLIEHGHTDDEEIRTYLKDLFSQIKGPAPDALVLGCTHYPIIKDRIKEIFPLAEIFDGGEGTARQTMRLLKSADLLTEGFSGRTEIITSTDGPEAISFATRVMSMIEILTEEIDK